MTRKHDDPMKDLAFLGRGIRRTILRDATAVALGAAAGALLGLIGAWVLGLSTGFGVRFGLLAGAFLGLAGRSLLRPLFDYDARPPADETGDDSRR